MLFPFMILFTVPDFQNLLGLFIVLQIRKSKHLVFSWFDLKSFWSSDVSACIYKSTYPFSNVQISKDQINTPPLPLAIISFSPWKWGLLALGTSVKCYRLSVPSCPPFPPSSSSSCRLSVVEGERIVPAGSILPYCPSHPIYHVVSEENVF